MGLARNLERRLERLADGISAAVFRGRMHPVDLANRLVRQADLLVVDEAGGPSIPNTFDVWVNDRDLDTGLDTAMLTAELNRTLHETATDRGWRISGPIDVRVGVDPAVGKGTIRCEATSQPAPLSPWGELTEHRGDRSFDLGDNRILVGRSDSAPIKLDEAEVSRYHGVIFREGGRLWLTDLQSANGTTINGRSVGTDPVEIGTGDMLSFGQVTFAVRVF
jgi:hypothetical protein